MRIYKVTTQISTSRELNRVSPNNIAERSTRYCNYSKDKFNNQISICKPYYYDNLEIADTVKEWRHIIDLRYYGTTGKPHPNAKIIAGLIRDQLIYLGYKFRD